MGRYVYVPQHCYAIIRDSSLEVAGLCTDGLQTCSSLAVKVIAREFYVLCHVDPCTLLNDPIHGLLEWLTNAPRDVENVVVAYDSFRNFSDEADAFRIASSTDVPSCRDKFYPAYYDDLVQRIVSVLPEELRSHVQLLPINNPKRGVILYAQDLTIAGRHAGDVVQDNNPMSTIEDECGEVVEYSDFRWGEFDRNMGLSGESRYPPMCIFDSKISANPLTVEEMMGLYAEKDYPSIACTLAGLFSSTPGPK